MAEKQQDPKKVTTPKFRVSFPHVFKPQKAMQAGGKEKYGIVMLFDKTTDLSALKKAAEIAAKEKWGEKIPKGIRSPFRDGSEKEYDGYEGKIFVSANSEQQPGVVDAQKNELFSEKDFYAGCFARATIRAFAYDTNGNKGISFGLNNIQKLEDGPSFSGRSKAEDDFEAVETGENEAGNYDQKESDMFP